MQDVIPLRIHRGNQVISGEAWRLFKESHHDQDFSDFWLEACMNFSICSFDLSTFFFFFVMATLLLLRLRVLRAL
jgi:hypothetical protein